MRIFAGQTAVDRPRTQPGIVRGVHRDFRRGEPFPASITLGRSAAARALRRSPRCQVQVCQAGTRATSHRLGVRHPGGSGRPVDNGSCPAAGGIAIGPRGARPLPGSHPLRGFVSSRFAPTWVSAACSPPHDGPQRYTVRKQPQMIRGRKSREECCAEADRRSAPTCRRRCRGSP